MAELSRDDVERIVRIEEGVQRIEGHLAEVRATLLDHRDRIRVLERWRWGTGAALVGMITLLAADSPAAALLSASGG